MIYRYFSKSCYAFRNHLRCYYTLYSRFGSWDDSSHTDRRASPTIPVCAWIHFISTHLQLPLSPSLNSCRRFHLLNNRREMTLPRDLRGLAHCPRCIPSFHTGNCHIALHSHAPMFFIVGGSASWSSRPNLKHMASIHAYPTPVGNPPTLSPVAVWHFLSQEVYLCCCTRAVEFG